MLRVQTFFKPQSRVVWCWNKKKKEAITIVLFLYIWTAQPLSLQKIMTPGTSGNQNPGRYLPSSNRRVLSGICKCSQHFIHMTLWVMMTQSALASTHIKWVSIHLENTLHGNNGDLGGKNPWLKWKSGEFIQRRCTKDFLWHRWTIFYFFLCLPPEK